MEDNTKQQIQIAIGYIKGYMAGSHPDNACDAIKILESLCIEPSAEQRVPSARQYLEDNFPDDIDENSDYVAGMMESYRDLCVEQKTKDWEKEKEELLNTNVAYGYAIFETNSIQEAREYVRKTFKTNF